MAEPSQVEVLAWMERTGGTPADAVRHFWPHSEPAERARRRNTVKQWAYRARNERGERAAPSSRTTSGPRPIEPTARPSPASSPAEATASAAADVPLVDYLRRQLAELERDLGLARSTGQLRIVAALDKRRSEVRGELEAALEPGRRVLTLERTATAVAAEILRRAKALEIRAEIERRRGGSCSPS